MHTYSTNRYVLDSELEKNLQHIIEYTFSIDLTYVITITTKNVQELLEGSPKGSAGKIKILSAMTIRLQRKFCHFMELSSQSNLFLLQ